MGAKSWLWAGVVVAAAIIAPAAWLQGQSPAGASNAPTGATRIAVLDVVRIFAESAQIKDLNSRMRQRQEEIAKEAQSRKDALDNRRAELEAFKPGSPDYESRRKDLIRMQIEARAWAEGNEAAVTEEQFDWTRRIYDQTLQAAEQIARDRGFDMVVQRSAFRPDDLPEPDLQSLRRMIRDRAVVYHRPEIDITDEVISRMDAEYKATQSKTAPATSKAGP